MTTGAHPFNADQPAEHRAVDNSRHELDAVRRHICHILGFDYGFIDLVRGHELLPMMTFSGDDIEEEYSLESLEDENQEPLSRSHSALSQSVARTLEPYIGRVLLKRRSPEAGNQFPYIIMPIVEAFDEPRGQLKGLLRLVSFDADRSVDATDLQTLKIVAQHLSTRLAELARSREATFGHSESELKHVAVIHGNRLVRRRLSRSLSGPYRVSETDDVERAMEVLREGPVDIALVDAEILMDSGEPLYKRLKDSQHTRLVPMILVTSEGGRTSKVDGLNAGADDCIDDDCIDAELLARVGTLIRVRKTEAELATQLKLLENYTERLEQVSERERLSSAKISRSHKELEQLNAQLKDERCKTEMRQGQDNLLHKISNSLRKSFHIEENIGEMLDLLSGYFGLDCCFVTILPDEDPEDTIRKELCSHNSYALVDKDRDLRLLEIFQTSFSIHEGLYASDVKRDKRIEPFRKDVLQHYHIYSLFYLPIAYEEKLRGLIGGHKCESEHVWSIDNQNFLRQVSDQLATSLANARLYKRVERLATTDGLTGLYNHRTGQEKLAEQLRLAERYHQRYQRALSVVMIDVDHFKSINDNYGHPVGDAVLKTLARVIKRDCRDVDIPVRYGGEEFLLILPEVNQEGALVVAERLRKTLSREAIGYEGHSLNVTASLGVATYPDDADNQKELLGLADKALYMSKRKGRNQVHSAADLTFQEYKEQQKIQSVPSTAQTSQEPVLVPEVVETVKEMAGRLYARSEYNKVHHLETARFAEMVAKVLGLSQKQVEQIRVASLLHDVGLLDVPDDILNKQGQVTADELKILMQHPVLGAEMLRHIPALKEICDILENHHECWDGTGYPRGLAGEEIPLAARIVSIVDAYHAMISDRPYRPAMTPEKARRVLKNGAGTQFDPFLVDIFLAVLTNVEGAA